MAAIGDTTPPRTICGQDVRSQVQCGQANTRVCFNQCTATDNSGISPNVRYSHDSSGFIQFTPQGTQQCATYPAGVTTVTATANDNCGLTHSDTLRVTVTEVDDQVPTINCAPNIDRTVDCGTTNSQVDFQASAFDNCGAVTVTYSSIGSTQFTSQLQSSATMNVGTSTVTAVAQDTSGRTATCETRVSITQVDDQVPTINCAPNIDRTVDCGTTNSQVDFQASAFDNCGAVTVTYSSIGSTQFTSQLQSSATMNVGTSTVTAVAQDTSGRTATCETRVSITQVDDQVPTINCAPNIDRTVDCGTTNSQVDFQASAFDNCGAVTVTYSSIGSTQFTSQPQSSATMNVGTSTVTAVAQDTSGRTATCETRVSITQVDNFPPTITCPANIPRELNCGVTSTVVQFTATAQDNCGAATVTYSSSGSTVFQPQSQGSASMNVGTSTVIAVATDSSQRTATCQFTVTVTQTDRDPPSIQCPANQQTTICTGQGNSRYTFTTAQATDNCGAVSVQYSGSGATNFQPQPQNNAAFNFGTTTVTATTTDSSGQSANCQFTVTVNSQNPCDNNNCQNGGQCAAFPGSCSQYSCECPPCYYGRFCENRIDACLNHKCENGAICQAQPNSCTDYSCTCPSCFRGPFCQTAVPDPCTNNPCVNGGQCSRVQGTCYAYQCSCQPGYEGVNCEIRTQIYVNPCNNFPCENGGSCACLGNNYYVCTCPSGYGGINCETPIAGTPNFESCNNVPCQNNGECYNGYDQNSATQGFYRNQYTCVCNRGFGGSNCLTSVLNNPAADECSGVFCRNGGTCVNAYFSYAQRTAAVCDCNIGFFGQFCEISSENPCLSNPCQNGAQCTPFNTYFVCACTGQFSGVTCEQGGGPTDTTPPTLTCPQDQTATVNPGQTFTVVNYPPATAFDNSGGQVSINYSPPSGSSFSANPPVTTVSVVASDPSGNVARCTFTVTVTTTGPGPDITPPNVNCPPNQQATIPQGQGGTVVTYPAATATDNSGRFVQLSYSTPSGNFFSANPPTTTVTVTARDSSGNQAICQFTVTLTPTGPVPDTTRPNVNCPQNQQATFPQGQGGTVVTYPAATATDNSGGFVQLSYSIPSGNFFSANPPTTTVTVTARDPSGNQAICQFTVTVTPTGPVPDTTRPNVNCPQNQQATFPQGQGGTVVTYPAATATDNSGGFVQLSYSTPSGNFFNANPPTTTVTVTARDPSGNQAICQFTVTVTPTGPVPDTTRPNVNCPQNQQATFPQGQGGTVVTYPAATATDNSGGFVQLSYSTPSGNFFNANPPTTTVTVTARDPSGNQATCQFTVTVTPAVVDRIPPVVICPQNQQATASQGAGGAVVTYPQATATDNSGGAVQLTYGNPSGTFFSLGQTVVAVTGRDPSGNVGQCTFTVTVSSVTVVDTIAPWPECPDNQVATVFQGQSGTAVTYPAATATDNNDQNVRLSYSQASGSTFNVGTTVVTVTATDQAGNSAQCIFAVTVNFAGQNAPNVAACNAASSQARVDTFVTLAAGSSSQSVTWNVPSAVPPSTAVRTHNSLNSGSQFQAGLTEIIYIYGNQGNEATCTYRVYVLGNNQHPCTSSPCHGQSTCFFSQTSYLCQNAGGRKRRDIEEELDCGPYCKPLGGICASRNHFGEPYEETQCFYPYKAQDPCDAQPCMNNGTCAPIYDLESTTRYFCFCPPGLEGKHCDLKSYIPYDNGAVDYIQEDGSMMLGYWFIYILLGVICLVVLFQSIVVCKLVAKKVRGIPSGYKHMDDKVMY
ncbi:uncharacterized protein [Amphiura filiformis]|uniref:uncharacterized protein n=1 Tax=Amphiura filiformis TaxID=82378 RepID=UPI003B22008C